MVNGIAASSYGLASLLAQTMKPGSEEDTKAASSAYSQAQARSAPGSTDTVTLSEQAKAAVAPSADARSIDTVVASARGELDRLLKAANVATALKDGRSTIDLSTLDRRSLWAVATNAGGKFTMEERVVATLQMNEARDAALAPAAAELRVTGDHRALYRAYLTNLDKAGAEEKASPDWARDRAAVLKGLDALMTKPGSLPVVENDPVAAYLKAAGGVVASPRTRDIASIATDVRAVIDAQKASGGADEPDFSKFDDRSLAAVALNKGGLFSEHETALAGAAVKARNWTEVSSRLAGSRESADPSAFGKSLLTHYSAMSDEERQAGGWTPALYEQMLEIQDMREKLASMFKSPDGRGANLLDYL